MRILNRWEPSRETTLQEQFNRVFGDMLERADDGSNLTHWAPAVDIFETEHELIVNADLPGVNPQNLDIRVEKDRKSTRLNSSHRCISYAVFCLKKKKKQN